MKIIDWKRISMKLPAVVNRVSASICRLFRLRGGSEVVATWKYGFIDRTGKEVIAPKYDDVLNFSEDLAGVMTGGKWGFIDRTGKEVVAPKYNHVESFSEGLAAVAVRK